MNHVINFFFSALLGHSYSNVIQTSLFRLKNDLRSTENINALQRHLMSFMAQVTRG